MPEASKRRGRPPKGPKSGKGHTLTTRITAETREALEAEAERTGRSISQVAEIWIEDGRKGALAQVEALGGPGLAPLLLAFARMATAIQAWEGASNEKLAAVLQALEETVRSTLLQDLFEQALVIAAAEAPPPPSQEARARELCLHWLAEAQQKRQHALMLAQALMDYRKEGDQ